MTRRSIHAGLWLVLGLTVPGFSDEGAAGGAAVEPAAAGRPLTVTVMTYEAASPGNPALGAQMSDILATRLSIEPALSVVERSQLQRVLDEQKLTLTGLVDRDEAVKVGRLVGAKLIILGRSFRMDEKTVIVTKLVGVETSQMVGSIRTVGDDESLSTSMMALAGEVVELIGKHKDKLLAPTDPLVDPVQEIRRRLAGRRLPAVAVVVAEQHLTRTVIDPAVQTEIRRTLLAVGVPVVDVGPEATGWAKAWAARPTTPVPKSLERADLVVAGEAFSEFALRTGELVTCVARAEVNLIDRRSGAILLSDRCTQRAVDLAEALAGRTALQGAGRRLGLAIARRLVETTQPATRPAAEPAQPDGHSALPGFVRPLAAAVLAALPEADDAAADAPTSRPTADEPTTRPAGDEPPARTVFAAPFENATGSEQYDPAAAGIGDVLAILLARQPRVAMVERQQLAALSAEQAVGLRGLTGRPYALAAGKLLKADTVLVGRLYLQVKKLMVNAQAIDIATSRVMAAEDVAFNPAELIEAALTAARGLGKQLSLPLPEIDVTKIDPSPAAGLHFAKGLGHFYSGDMDSALMQFMRTIDLDPNFTEVSFFSGLCYMRLAEYAHAAIEFRTFLKDEPGSPYAHRARELLEEAQRRDKESGVERFGPDDQDEVTRGQDAEK